MNRARVNHAGRAIAFVLPILVGFSGLCSEAHAQAWLPDRQYTEGPGIRVGDLELHPGIAIRGGYDTNVFKADGDQKDATGRALQPVEGAGILAVTPHLHLSTLGALRKEQGEGKGEAVAPIAFRAGLAATYLHYFLEDAPKNVEIDTDAWLGILPQRVVNFEIAAAYMRTVRPFTQNAGSGNAYAFDRIVPNLRVNFGSKSQVLTAYIAYTPQYAHYESRTFSYLNGFTHSIEGGSAWKFLPHTALLYDAGVDLQRYSETNVQQTASPVLYSNSTRFRTRLGINGALTNNFTLRVLAGYAEGQYNSRALDEYEDAIGEAVLGYRFGGANKLELGYRRDVQGSAIGGWVRNDRGFASANFIFAQVFSLGLEAGAAYVSYGRVVGLTGAGTVVGLGLNGDTSRDDVRIDGAVRAEYRVTNWLALLADVSAQSVITDFEYAVQAAGAAPIPDPAGFTSIQAYGGIRAHY